MFYIVLLPREAGLSHLSQRPAPNNPHIRHPGAGRKLAVIRRTGPSVPKTRHHRLPTATVAESPRAQANPATAAAPTRKLLELLLEGGPAGGGEDDGVPDALERQDDGAGEVEGVAGAVRVHERVDAVDAARGPRDEDGDGEDERRAQVRELYRVQVLQFVREPAPDPGERVAARLGLPRSRRRDARYGREGLGVPCCGRRDGHGVVVGRAPGVMWSDRLVQDRLDGRCRGGRWSLAS